MEGSGVATITGRTLTVGGHQIEKISSATLHHAGRSTSSARQSRSHWSRHQRTRPWPLTPCTTGFTYLRRRNVGLVSAGLVTYGAVRASESCLSRVAALAQGDRGEQRGACEQRGRQIQRIVQRAGEGRVPRLDDLVQRSVSG